MKEEIMESVMAPEVPFKIRVNPNPTSDHLQITGNSEIRRVEVVNMAGQRVLNIRVGNEPVVNLDITDLPSSIYLVNVKDMDGNVSSGKFIKK
jgi:hypothetical protein